ncbi:MAG: phage/plasmid primase, P4 family [Planctomycetota bacterium]
MNRDAPHDPIDTIGINDLLGSNYAQQPKTKLHKSTVSPPASATPSNVTEVKPVVQTQANVSTTAIKYSNKERELTDLGNAERLVDMYGHELRYCHVKERWYYWDGVRWAWANAGEMTRYAAEVTRSIAVESYLPCNVHQSSKVLKHAQFSQHQLRIKAMIDIARDLLPIPVSVDALDADPWKFNCLNGTVNLKTGQLEAHNPDDLITKIAPVNYDSKASYTGWLRFLRQITGNDKQLIRYLRRMVGYCLTGSCQEHALFMFWGKGANGKSTFFVVIQNMMGEYAIQAPPDLLTARGQGPAHPCDIADLHGARLAVDSEVGQNIRMDEAKAKRLTGGDRVKGRPLFKDFIEFDPTFKLAATVNDKPKVPGDDDALYRRMHLVPFIIQIPAEQQDKHLPEKLKREASGILRWAVEGCLEWARDGLQPPQCVVDATEEYRSEMDSVGTFIGDACSVGKGLEIQAGNLYNAYEYWASKSGLDPMTKTMFGKTIKKRGFKQKRGSKGHRIYLGITAGMSGDEDCGTSTLNQIADSSEPVDDPLELVPDRYDDSDPLSFYIREWGYGGGHLVQPLSHLRGDYNSWANKHGYPQYDEQELADALGERGWTVERNVLDDLQVQGFSFEPGTNELLDVHRTVRLRDSWHDNEIEEEISHSYLLDI